MVLTTRPRGVALVVDRSAATALPFDHDGDASTPDVSPAQITDEILANLSAVDPSLSECSGTWPALVLAPGLSASQPASSCATDFATVAPTGQAPYETDALFGSAPASVGGAPIGAAVGRAVELLEAGGFEAAGGVMFLSGPAGCGDDVSGEVLDPTIFAQTGDLRWVVVRTGPAEGQTPVADDARPDTVDLAQFWSDVEDDPMVDAVIGPGAFAELWQGTCGALSASTLRSPRCQISATCEIDLSIPPNTPPPSRDAVDEVLINGESFGPVEASEASCNAGAVDGWIWLDDARIAMCGAACDAMAPQCQGTGASSQAVLEVEISYACR